MASQQDLSLEVKASITQALRNVCVVMPHLSGLASAVTFRVVTSIPTIGVFASGTIIVNPGWFLTLHRAAATFVVAHELLHLAYRTHERAKGTNAELFNVAHDAVINDVLSYELGIAVPAGGIDLKGARWKSAEQLYASFLESSARGWQPPPCWKALEPAGETALGVALRRAGIGKSKPAVDSAPAELQRQGTDCLDDDLERQFFPELARTSQVRASERITREAVRSSALERMREQMDRLARKSWFDHESVAVRALATAYRAPWQMVVQRWLEAATPVHRTFARPSRRGAERTDIVLPGRVREGRTLHIVFDVSASMGDAFSVLLGVIGTFCRDAGMSSVHIVQCDTEVTQDQWIDPSELGSIEVTGLGGSDMSPAMLLLAADPEVQGVVVITDGQVDVPAEAMPYAVLLHCRWPRNGVTVRGAELGWQEVVQVS
jgi:predicted metal-dependent peptidase